MYIFQMVLFKTWAIVHGHPLSSTQHPNWNIQNLFDTYTYYVIISETYVDSSIEGFKIPFLKIRLVFLYPDAQCMVYLPTFTTTTIQMLPLVTYIEHLGY